MPFPRCGLFSIAKVGEARVKRRECRKNYFFPWAAVNSGSLAKQWGFASISETGVYMPCLILLLTLLFPRLAIVVLFFLTNFFERAYHSLLLLALGFLFLPLTTIVYAWILNGRHPIEGVYLVAIVISALVDLGLIGHGEYHRRRAG
jgi:hypothetical protein